jgi:hypothetical protein
MIKTIARTIRVARMLGRGDVKSYARGYLDQALQGYGYVRGPVPSVGMALPMVGAFGAGVAVGTGIGVLIAPKSGAETRAMLRQRIEELLRDVSDATSEKSETAAPPDDGQSRIITDDPEITHGGPIGH